MPVLSEGLVPPGWKIRPGKNFNTFVGPFYERDGGDAMHAGFVTDERHGNKRGVTHGGMIATSFDVALGNAAWSAANGERCATVQLTIQYVGALQLHEFAEVTVEVIRANSEPGIPARPHGREWPHDRDRRRGLENPEMAGGRRAARLAFGETSRRLRPGLMTETAAPSCPQHFVVRVANRASTSVMPVSRVFLQ